MHGKTLPAWPSCPAPPTPAVTNPCDRKKCEWLCLLSPSGPVCTCPNGKRLDNGTCVVVPSPTISPVGTWGLSWGWGVRDRATALAELPAALSPQRPQAIPAAWSA